MFPNPLRGPLTPLPNLFTPIFRGYPSAGREKQKEMKDLVPSASSSHVQAARLLTPLVNPPPHAIPVILSLLLFPMQCPRRALNAPFRAIAVSQPAIGRLGTETFRLNSSIHGVEEAGVRTGVSDLYICCGTLWLCSFGTKTLMNWALFRLSIRCIHGGCPRLSVKGMVMEAGELTSPDGDS